MPAENACTVRNLYEGAHGVLVVYDVTDEESFDHIKHWYEDVMMCASPGVVVLLIGNTCNTDFLKQVVSYTNAKDRVVPC